jgi:hypothetical protein
VALAYGKNFVGIRENKVDGWEFQGSLITSSSSPGQPPLERRRKCPNLNPTALTLSASAVST